MENEKLFLERQDRFNRAINLETVDKIPTIFMGAAFVPNYVGRTQAEYCSNPDSAIEMAIAALEKLGDVDGINMMPAGYQTVNLSNLWLSKVLTPGRELAEDTLWQVVEKEVMSEEDYDFIVDQGWQTFTEKTLPKIMDMDLFRAHQEWVQSNISGIAPKFHKAGYVVTACASTTIPFERLCGARSLSKFFMDLFRIPEKVKAAMDVMLPDMIEVALRATKAAGVPRVWVGGWRSASGLIGPKIWDTLVFPYFNEIIHALSEKGIVCVLHWDHNWTRDLERLLEFPAKKCILNPDGMTDIRKAKEILGDHMAIMGDVPAPLFAIGTPDDIYEYVRSLVRDLGPTGLILCPGCDAPINTKPENMEAFVSAAREFGAVGQ